MKNIPSQLHKYSFLYDNNVSNLLTAAKIKKMIEFITGKCINPTITGVETIELSKEKAKNDTFRYTTFEMNHETNTWRRKRICKRIRC